MIDLEQRLRRTYSGLAGNEALSDSPDENAAAEILKWSEELARYFVLQTGDMEDAPAEEYLAPYMRALRTMMKAVSRWASETDPAIRAEWWTRIEQNAKVLYGGEFALPAMDEVMNTLPSDGGGLESIVALKKVIENQAAKG
jgi:hypothetical protein